MDFHILSYTSTYEILTLLYTWSLKKVTLIGRCNYWFLALVQQKYLSLFPSLSWQQMSSLETLPPPLGIPTSPCLVSYKWGWPHIMFWMPFHSLRYSLYQTASIIFRDFKGNWGTLLGSKNISFIQVFTCLYKFCKVQWKNVNKRM